MARKSRPGKALRERRAAQLVHRRKRRKMRGAEDFRLPMAAGAAIELASLATASRSLRLAV